MWYYVQLVGDPIQNVLASMTIEKVRLSVNSLLAYGVKGINYYTTYNSIVDYNGRKMGLFNEVKQLNAETLKVGNEMLNFKSQLVYPIQVMSKIITATKSLIPRSSEALPMK